MKKHAGAHHKSSRRRSARGMLALGLVPREGDGAPKSARPMARALKARGRLSARQSRVICGAGPRFPVRESRSWLRRSEAASASPRRASRPKAGSATPKSSASSWQGLVMGTGGAPTPPECLACVAKPAGTAPHPASRRLMKTPLKRMRWVQRKRGLAAGDKVGTDSTKPSCHRPALGSGCAGPSTSLMIRAI